MIDGKFEMKIAGSLHILLFTKISEFKRHTSYHKTSLFGIFVSLDVFQHFVPFLHNKSKPDIRQALRSAFSVSDERWVYFIFARHSDPRSTRWLVERIVSWIKQGKQSIWRNKSFSWNKRVFRHYNPSGNGKINPGFLIDIQSSSKKSRYFFGANRGKSEGKDMK